MMLMIGAFPPPVHGMSFVNSAVRGLFIESGGTCAVISTSGVGLDRSLLSRMMRFGTVVSALWMATRRLLLKPSFGRSNNVVYLSLSGGYGQVYDVAFATLARLSGWSLILHHHSFAYIDRPTWIARLLFFVSGRNARHVALSRGMSERLVRAYNLESQFYIISNSLFVRPPAAPMYRSESRRIAGDAGVPIKIGFLGNISFAKGIIHYLESVRACSRAGVLVEGVIAGPYQDREIEGAVQSYLQDPIFRYVGPVYDEEKAEFLAEIDVLLFPSLYKNEAEPVTIHEAHSFGVPVIAYGRGSIPEIVPVGGGLVVSPTDCFQSAALGKLQFWATDHESFKAASIASRFAFEMQRKQSATQWKLLTGLVLRKR